MFGMKVKHVSLFLLLLVGTATLVVEPIQAKLTVTQEPAEADEVDVTDEDAADGEDDGEDEEQEAELTPEERAGFSSDEAEKIREGEEQFEFQAEVSRLMDIIINSLYSNREIFLRELISNASDALDKIRYQSLTDKGALGEGETADLEIRVKFDKKARTLTVRDRGVGMTKENLVKQLGVVASSGTTQFLDAAAKGGDALSLIGQFGVGFYSVYLVADQVTVVSKHNDDEQYIWQSTANAVYTISQDPRGNTLGRGTEVILHLKEDATEFLNQETLERIIGKYSEFINFPIYLYKMEQVTKEVPIGSDEDEAADNAAAAKRDLEENPLPPGVGDVDEDELSDEELKIKRAEKEADPNEPVPEDDDGLEVTDEDEDADADAEDDTPKTKTVQEEVWDWQKVNENKAIWTRRPSEVTEDEYDEFFKALTKDQSGKMAHNHFVAEGEINFRAILFVPKVAPFDLYDKYYAKNTGLKLYVRRVLISDEFEDFMPRYLNFIKGVVDSDDLPLNVSRETLSKSRVLKVMGKKLTRKALDMLKKLARTEEDAEEEAKEKAEAEAQEDEAKEDEEKKEKEDEEDEDKITYADFWSKYGKSIKLGVIEDSANRSKLTKLLRFVTSKSEDKPISLQKYVDNMQEKQKFIYYITGESLETIKNSPFLEQLHKRDFEVLYMPDALDEYVMTHLNEFDGTRFMSVTKEGLKFGDEGDFEKRLEKALKEKYEPLTDWLKELYGDKKVEKVVVSKRVADSPCVLVTSQYGWSANMERIMKAQTFADKERQKYMVSKKTLEINTRHPLIRELLNRVESDPEGQAVKDIANLMYDQALLRSGFAMDNVQEFAARMQRVLNSGLDLAPDTPVAEEDDVEVPEEEEEEDDEDDEEELDLDGDEEEEDEEEEEGEEDDEEGEEVEDKDEL